MLGMSEDEPMTEDALRELLQCADWRDIQFYRRLGSHDVKAIVPGCDTAVCYHADNEETHTMDCTDFLKEKRIVRLAPDEAFRLRPALRQLIETFA